MPKKIDRTANRLNRTREDLLQQAVEYYQADIEDFRLALERLQDPSDTTLDWDEVKRELLDQE